MLPEERRRRIGAAVEARGMARLDDLAAAIGVSVDTVRRDVDALHSDGVVERTRGGAVARGAHRGIVPLRTRMESGTPEKREIARAAAELVADGTSLVINGGSTTLAFAEALGLRRRLSIVTNSLQIPVALPAVAIAHLHVLGGRVHPEVGATVGSGVFRGDAPVSADVAVVGVGGLSAARGLSMADADEAVLTAEMIRAASRTIVLCDADKFEREALAPVAALTEIDMLVTDAHPPAALARALRAAGVEAVVASAGSRILTGDPPSP